MYKYLDKLQHSFHDFNQPLGMHMNPENRWVRLAEQIPWDVFESKYADLFPNDTGNVAKLMRTALGSLIIQKKLGFSDREFVEQITENPYLQYFIGLHGYQQEPPFDASTLVLFRKRLSPEIIMEANDYILNQQISFEAYNNTDRIEVKREFSVEKHSYGLGLIITKLEETQLTSTALSVFTANLFKMQRGLVLCL